MNLYELTKHSIRRHGLIGCARKALHTAQRVMRNAHYLHESHVWYRLDLRRKLPPAQLPMGLELVQGGVEQFMLLESLETVGRREALRRLATGTDLWIVRAGTQPIFCCWIFHRTAPLLAAPGGRLTLPSGSVALEDPVTAPDYRGRGIAPAALIKVAEMLALQGFTAIVGKVEKHNIPSRHMLEKAGFEEIATMDLERVWLKPHVKLSVQRQGSFSMFLTQQLSR